MVLELIVTVMGLAAARPRRGGIHRQAPIGPLAHAAITARRRCG
jgi:hypothetical protein